MLSISEIIRPPEIFTYVHGNTYPNSTYVTGTVYLKRKQTAYVVCTIKNIKTKKNCSPGKRQRIRTI